MIHKISFAFDDATKQAYDIKVESEGEPQISPIREEVIELTNTSLQLTPDVLKDLNAIRQGTKIALSLEPGGVVKLINPKLYPVAGDGSTLSKKHTISVRGKNQQALAKLGQQFRTQRLQLGVVLLHPVEIPVVEGVTVEEVSIDSHLQNSEEE